MSLDLEAIKARAEAATPGPWELAEQWSAKHGRWNINAFGRPGHHSRLTWEEAGGERIAETSKPNAEFIAHARTDVPALVAEVEALRSIVRRFAECETECESECFYCGGSAVGGPSHDADCPHVLALAYMKADPA